MFTFNQYTTLGVINMTPNSFSDQGKSLVPQVLKEQLQSFLHSNNVIVDIGFESTAPMNEAVSAHEEWERFIAFLSAIKGIELREKVISLDTYKVENFLKMAAVLKAEYKTSHIIFNDVSGCLDAELSHALTLDNFSYIYTFSHIPSRSDVLKHMKFQSSRDVVQECLESFTRACDFFDQRGMLDRLILDPGFGFSKSYEQNWELINRFSELTDELKKQSIKNPILIGLSKKSFLRKALKTESFSESELLHFKCLVDLMKSTKHPLLFRVHDPRIVELAHTFSL